MRNASTARTDCASEKAHRLLAKKRVGEAAAEPANVSNWAYAAIGSEPACFLREDGSARRCARS